jgi:hypothetical protein
MKPLQRRLFVKTLAGAAVATSRIFSASSLPMLPGLRARAGSSAPTVLEHGEQQLRFAADGEPFGFQNFLRVAGEWKPATLPGNVLIAGPSFNFVTASVSHSGKSVIAKGSASAEDIAGKPIQYEWKSEVTAIDSIEGAPWYCFRTALSLRAPLRLRQESRVEPQVILWLHSASTLMEGQSGSWRRVELKQPTRNSLGVYGNDLPAVYLLDQNEGVETMMYFDLSDAGWMSLENLPRFLVYRCSEVSSIEKDGNQRLGVGLAADHATGNTLPAGEIRFTYYLMQRPLDRLLTEQQATVRWMSALLPLFSERLDWPKCSTTWTDFANGTVADLKNKDASQIEVDGHAGLLAYVKDSSKIWKQPPANFELMTVADVLWPSLLYLRLHPDVQFSAECDRLLESVPRFYDPRTKTIANDIIHSEENGRVDSWYPFENGLIKFPVIGALTSSPQISADFLSAFDSAREVARQYDYLFPIYYRVATRQAEGAGTNYSVGGLYAWGAILAYRITTNEKYLEEGRRAINALCNAPADRLFHEPQELGYAALAAAELGMQDSAAYLLSQQLRMFYWYSDPTQPSHDIRGMVQACASILYPAFKENVEAILPWTGVFKRGIVWEGLLRFMDQQRRNNFYFFQNCSSAAANQPAAFIPFENLGTLELGGQTGNVGKEIYGSGEVLWMYLMFEALGKCADRELMLVNLDLLDAVKQDNFPPRELNFLLYNPTPYSRSASISIPAANGTNVQFTADGKATQATLQIPGNSFVRLRANF